MTESRNCLKQKQKVWGVGEGRQIVTYNAFACKTFCTSIHKPVVTSPTYTISHFSVPLHCSIQARDGHTKRLHQINKSVLSCKPGLHELQFFSVFCWTKVHCLITKISCLAEGCGYNGWCTPCTHQLRWPSVVQTVIILIIAQCSVSSYSQLNSMSNKSDKQTKIQSHCITTRTLWQ